MLVLWYIAAIKEVRGEMEQTTAMIGGLTGVHANNTAATPPPRRARCNVPRSRDTRRDT